MKPVPVPLRVIVISRRQRKGTWDRDNLLVQGSLSMPNIWELNIHSGESKGLIQDKA